MRVAVLGTGTMGAAMAVTMRRAGLEVVAWNRTKEKAQRLADKGVAVADSVSAAVEGADAVVTMLFDLDAVLSVTADIVGALAPTAVWIQSSTVGPDGIRRIADAAGDAPLLDAPVLGTKQPAEQGTLVVLVSGDTELIERAQPVFEAIGNKTVLAGSKLGDASALKLACNAWILSITVAAAQSLALAEAQGIAPSLFLEAIAGTASDTPYAQMKGRAMLAGDFSPAFGIDGGRKDLRLIIEAARAHGVDARMLEAVLAYYDSAAEHGHGDDDLAAVYT
ncbi:MAG TPA: NAD(P)-dependent oxidoreductase, partial [Jatrophihabitans sp.]|nr:NAD(P)-dependent oxidoreductase [Jatrophihabitans sp.]